MNQRATALLLLLIVVVGFGAFVFYDLKHNNRLGFRHEEPQNNWQWTDEWKVNPDQPKILPKEEPKQPEKPKEQVVASTFAEAIKKAAELKMQILVVFEVDWCSWCQKLKKETLSNPKVKEAMKKYVFVEINTDKDRATGKKFGVRYLPTYAITNAQEEKLKVDGGFKTPDQFVQWLGEPDKKPDNKPEDKKIKPREEDKNPPPDNRRRPRRPQMCSEVNLD